MIRNLVTAIVLAMAAPALAGVDRLAINQVPNGDGGSALANRFTQDIAIDFTGRWTGGQIQVELTAGSVYQSPVGDDGPPNPGLFASFPDLEFDSYVAAGNLTNDLIIGGGAVDIWAERNPDLVLAGQDAPAARQFDAAGLYASWFTAPGADPAPFTDQTDFVGARISLSRDAVGEFWFLSSVDSLIEIQTGRIRGGRLLLPGEYLVGDFDQNDQVDDTDLSVLMGNWGAVVGPDMGNLDGIGAVGDRDLGLFLASYTGDLGLGGSAGGAINPEPASMMILSFGAMALLRRPRR